MRKIEVKSSSDISTLEQARALYGEFNDLIASLFLFLLGLFIGVLFYSEVEGCSCTEAIGDTIEGCVPDRCRYTGGVVLSWKDAIYMSLVTVTTLGFGELHPTSRNGRMFGSLWMLVSVGFSANFVRAATQVFVMQKTQRKYVLAKKLSRDIFKAIDADGNGRITRGEFRRYLLVRFHLVQESVLDSIDAQFDALDEKRTGMITFEDLQKLYKESEESAKSTSAGAQDSRLPVQV